MKETNRKSRALLMIAAAVAAGAPAVRAGTSGDAVTISLSGSTAMRNFTISEGFSLLTPGTSITLNSGIGAAPVTYTASTSAGTIVQLAKGDFTTGVTANPGIGAPPVTSAQYAAIRLEWHEQGSVEGIVELADSQISDLIFSNLGYTPTSGNATYVNRNKFGGTAPTNAVGTSPGGHTLNAFTSATDRTTANIQNRVQMAISDVNAYQGFSRPGAAAYNAAPGAAGFGKGNSALAAGSTIAGIGQAGRRQQLVDESELNMSTSAIDHATGLNYTAGPWNSAGLGNLDNKVVAITATGFAANPGTGLTKINRTDAQWLQATGRLSNGADFNVATRDVNSGTRNVAAVNVGLDPSYAVGELDSGDGNSATGGTTQTRIGTEITFSNKTSGGSQLRPTVQNSRMAIGHLSISDSISAATNSASRPLRVLDYRDDGDDVSNGSNATIEAGFADPASNTFARLSAANIVSGAYAVYQNQTYVTVKQPDAAFAGDSVATWSAYTDATTGIKGDNAGDDVADFRANVLQSVSTFPATGIANPADQLIQTSFILPQFMVVRKDRDGLNQSLPNPSYDSGLSAAFLGSSSLTSKFNVADPATITKGSTSRYGDVTSAGTGSILITNQNYLFGDFNQNGIRDFAAIKTAQAAQAALEASGAGTTMFGGSVNTAAVASLPTALATMTGFDSTAGAKKGDLIVMGDMDSNGAFDGRDLYLMARGAALADDTSTDQLTAASGTTFGERVRAGVLRKNAALDYMATNATAAQKMQASANLTNDPTGANAFNKADINRDGLINRKDAQLVDCFVGKNYRSLSDQLSAVIAAENGTALDGRDANGGVVAETATPISLVDVELNDTGEITHLLSAGTSDFKVVRDAVGSALLDGDANFDGMVDIYDLQSLAKHWLQGVDRWSLADFNFDGTVNASDLGLLSNNWQQTSGTLGEAVAALGLPPSAVPEPASLGVIALGGMSLLRRRRRA